VDALLELARLLYVPRFSQCVSVLSCSLLWSDSNTGTSWSICLSNHWKSK
jgi:hypothetical protein